MICTPLHPGHLNVNFGDSWGRRGGDSKIVEIVPYNGIITVLGWHSVLLLAHLLVFILALRPAHFVL